MYRKIQEAFDRSLKPESSGETLNKNNFSLTCSIFVAIVHDIIPDPNKIVFKSMNMTAVHILPGRSSYCTKTCKYLTHCVNKTGKSTK